MKHVDNWILGASAAILGVGGLFVASHVGHGIGYYGGLIAFLFAALFIMKLIKASTEH